MIENPIKALAAAGRPIINGWLSLGSAFAAEIQAELGFDSLTADMQHGLCDYRDAVATFQAIRASGIAPLTRVPWLEPGIVMKSLDAGALGVICPMINNRAQAETLVSYMRYPPLGMRSFGPTRALVSAGADYASKANDSVVCLAMVETAEAFENLQEIVTTRGLDGIYIGPSDLAIGLTNGRLGPGFDRRETELVDATKRILEAAKNAGILAGLHCGSPAYAAEAIGWGFDLVTLTSDARILADGASERLAEIRALLGEEQEAKATASGY
ncbi:MAG: aldolase/citrate lyase family protein [Rhodobacteraceae bacterium]|nr:aldolase/citrate lyase family protein [Paracoccaceae bacterium]